MLRFDVPPVWSNVTRLEAFISFLVSVAALLFTPWLMLIPAIQGFVRGFFGHHKCPMHHAGIKLLTSCNRAGKQENAGAKMFANKILFIASTVAVVAYALGSNIWMIPVSALIVFTTLEWAFSFCAACWAYVLWYSKFPPQMD
ncbi:MAG: DUF4395 domain-containing protein [Gammaproteobacteria bacterium]|nr:DUF4395 domain-containing protein [Gammaproteobacteria bacterium]